MENNKWQKQIEVRFTKIEGKIDNLDDLIRNFVLKELAKLNGRMWKLVFSMLGIFIALSIAMLVALLK